MTPGSFAEQTVVFAKNQPQYLPLPAHLDSEGVVTMCWQLTWRERLQIIMGGKVWQQVLTFGGPLQPQKMLAEKPHLPRGAV